LSGRLVLLLISLWLLTIAFVIDNYWSASSSLQSAQQELHQYVTSQEKDFMNLTHDSKVVHEISAHRFTDSTLAMLQQKKYYIFIYVKGASGSDSLSFWSTSIVKPASYLLYENASQGFLKMPNGYYVWQRMEADSVTFMMLLPVQWQYGFPNEYLKNDFLISGIDSRYFHVTSDSKNGLAIVNSKAVPLFYINKINNGQPNANHPLALIFYLLSFVLLLLWLQQVSKSLQKKYGLLTSVFFFIISVTTVRYVGLYFDFPVALHQFDSFHSGLTHFGFFGKSIGDLFLNFTLLNWVLFFIRLRLLEWKVARRQWSYPMRQLINFIAALLILYFTFTLSQAVRMVVSEPKISFEVFNFFSINQFSVFGFLALVVVSMSFFFCCQILVILLRQTGLLYSVSILLYTAIIALLIFTLDKGAHFNNFHVYLLCWLLLLISFFSFRIFDLSKASSSSARALFWLMFFSASVSTLLLFENRKKEIEERKKYAETLSIKSDESNETLVNTMLSGFRSEMVRTQFDRFKDPFSNITLKDSLLRDNTSNYDNNFETRVYVFDALRKPLFNDDSTSFSQLNAILNTQARQTKKEGLYFFDQSYEVFSYLYERTIDDTSGNLNGYLFVLSTPKKQRREAIYPELFTKGKNNAIENAEDYAIAIYHNGNIVRSINEYAFPSILSNAKEYNDPFMFFNKNGYGELWYHGNSNVSVAIVKADNSLLQFITLFSYVFCSFLIVAIVFWALAKIESMRTSRFSVKKYLQVSIRNQIHGTIIFISVLSFVIIGVATILFFYDRYETTNKDKLTRVIHIMEKEVDEIVDKNWLFTDSLSAQNIAFRDKELEYVIKKIADIHGVDANMYDLKGDLMVASLNLPYAEGILSNKMNPQAFHHMSRLREIQFVQRENIGNLEFSSIYIPVTDKNARQVAYLNIPYFTSQNALKLEISNFLVAIINLNAFIFLIAGIISFFITNRITSTFTLIRDKMRAINLASKNEIIIWNRHDEIGALVQEYNKMVHQLEESAHVLATSEREGAWKEMAQQVAHEIKNPLTPMKLSMQYLQKALDNDADNIKELTKNVVQTLIEQIDHLSNIANAFSQFARIGDAQKTKLNINDVIRSVCHLHEANPNIIMQCSLITEPLTVYADKTQMNRLFTNLIINAIQAVPETKLPEIFVTQKIEGEYLVTRIIDNGQGIGLGLRDKIFTPNFTTKNSGTGLGLAMCKRIVEQTAGDIWFDSEVGKGTSFYVKLPITNA
jgi:two-component system nitrogen regulation sensor histidine kinase NtrY